MSSFLLPVFIYRSYITGVVFVFAVPFITCLFLTTFYWGLLTQPSQYSLSSHK